MYLTEMDMYQYMLCNFMPIRGLRVQKYTQNMAICYDFDKTSAYFLAPYYQYMLQQCQT